MSTETEKALLWQANQRAIAAHRLALARRLQAPPGPAAAVRAGWAPVSSSSDLLAPGLSPLTTTPSWVKNTSDAGFGGDNLYEVAFGGGLFVAAGNNGKIATATDPKGTWTQRLSGWPLPSVDYVWSLGFGGGIWVAVGKNQKIATSLDGIDWTLNLTPGAWNPSPLDVAYGNGIWTAVGSNGKIGTAADPAGAWTINADQPTAYSYNAVGYGAGVWVGGISYGGPEILTYATNPAGHWTPVQGLNPALVSIFTLAYANGVWVAAGSLGFIATSEDGITWTVRNSGTTESIVRCRWAGSRWVGVCFNGKLIDAVDPRGVWTTRRSPTTRHLYGVAYGNGVAVAAGFGSTILTADIAAGQIGDLLADTDGHRLYGPKSTAREWQDFVAW